jgi:hypothetical protein
VSGRARLGADGREELNRKPCRLALNVSRSSNSNGRQHEENLPAVRSGKLAEPFNAAMVKRVCPGWAERTYRVFLSKHAVGNGITTELF